MEEFRFKVNLEGMIEILSDHLYSSPDVYVRELLQNGVDAIVAREKMDAGYKEEKQGKLLLQLKDGEKLSFRDNGIGLTKEEVHKFLAVIGQSSKKDIESGKILSDYIGRFGIGLLSCFMVSDEIRIRTRSIQEEQGYEWIGKPDGTYILNEVKAEISVGTEILLSAKKGFEEYFCCEKIEELILHYGLILPYPVLMDDGQQKKRINPVTLPWTDENASKNELMLFGQMMFQSAFLDCVPLHSEAGGIDGVAYFLPYSVQASIKQEHLIYLKNMLLTEKGEGILPDWAVFTKCIINAKDLRPTASREGFYEDDTLRMVKKELGLCIIEYLKNMAKNDPQAFQQFLDIHELVVRSMAIEDDELYQLFIDELTFETTRGTLTGLELRMTKEPLLYCGMKEYRQLSQVFVAQNHLLLNTGYVYTYELLTKMQEFFDVEVQKVDAYEVGELLKDVSLEQAEMAVDFLETAEKVLKDYDCDVEVKQFIPANLPAFYYLDQNALLSREIDEAIEASEDLFADMLGNFQEELKQSKKATLYFNMRNPLIKKMVQHGSDSRLEDSVMILYVQTLLIGGFTLRNNELAIMNDKLLSMLERGLSND